MRSKSWKRPKRSARKIHYVEFRENKRVFQKPVNSEIKPCLRKMHLPSFLRIRPEIPKVRSRLDLVRQGRVTRPLVVTQWRVFVVVRITAGSGNETPVAIQRSRLLPQPCILRMSEGLCRRLCAAIAQENCVICRR